MAAVFKVCLVFAAVVGASPAHAVCKTWADMKDYLAAAHRETPVGMGITSTRDKATVLVLFVGEKSWTLVRRRPGGPTCYVEAGSYWWPAGPKAVRNIDRQVQ